MGRKSFQSVPDRSNAVQRTSPVIRISRSQRFGVDVVLYDARHSDSEMEEDEYSGRWVTICDKHNTLCFHSTLALAISHMPWLNWCEECMSTVQND